MQLTTNQGGNMDNTLTIERQLVEALTNLQRVMFSTSLASLIQSMRQHADRLAALEAERN